MVSDPVSADPDRLRRVWITRAQPAAEATAARLRALGFEPVVAPVLEVRPIAGVRVDLMGVDALAFTSAAGVSAFAALTSERTPVVFAVGHVTASAARAAGFHDVRAGPGDVQALAGFIAAGPRPPSLVLNPTAADPAADLPALLAALGVAARSIAVYETRDRVLDAAPTELGAVLIHSPKGGRAVARLLQGQDVLGLAAHAISPAAAAPLMGLVLRSLTIAAAPNEDALLSLLES